MSLPAPTCARCGYDLTGIGSDRWATCPECGAVNDSAHPQPRPWPHPLRLVLMLGGPSTAILAIAAVMSWLEHVVPAYGLFEQVSILLVIGAFGAPIVVSWRVAVTYGVRYERRLLWMVLALLSLVYVMVLGVALLVFLSWS